MKQAMTNLLLNILQNSSNTAKSTTTNPKMRLTSTLDAPTAVKAAHDALSISEILENIFSNLNALELNRAKCVSHTWNFVISDWRSLRKAGFVEADYSANTRMLHIYKYAGCFWEHSSYSPLRMSELHLLRSYAVARIVHVHPYLTPRCLSKHLSVSQMEVDFPNLHKLFALPGGGSWEKTFLTQPPITRMTFEIHGKILGPGIRVDLSCEPGLTLGMVIGALRTKVPEIPAPKSCSKPAQRLTKQIHVIRLVAGIVSADSSLVSQADMFEAEDGKVRSKEERRRHPASVSMSVDQE